MIKSNDENIKNRRFTNAEEITLAPSTIKFHADKNWIHFFPPTKNTNITPQHRIHDKLTTQVKFHGW